MKKIILTLVLVAAAATSAMAQFSIGAGYLSQNSKYAYSSSSTNTVSNGFYAGADADYNLGMGFSVVPGIYYGYLTSDASYFGVANSSTKSHYIAVPVNFKYSIAPVEMLKVFAYAGPQFELGVSSKTTASALGVNTSLDNYGDDGKLNRFNLSLGVGLGVDISDIVRIKGGYSWGLLNMLKDADDNASIKTSFWHIGAAFLF